MAKQHGYQPTAIARRLNSRRSGLGAIGVNAIDNQCEAEQLELLVHRLQARALVPIILLCQPHRPFAAYAPRVNLPSGRCRHRLRFNPAEGCGANIQDEPSDYRLGRTNRRRQGFMRARRWRRGRVADCRQAGQQWS
jgi:hypothetical protein